MPIYAVSAENEPDSQGLNATTWFTATEMATWVGTYLGPALASTGAKVMAPETMNWYGIGDYLTALQNNADAWKYTEIVATHEYGGNPQAYPQIAQAGKEFWETEIYDTNNDSPSSVADGIDSGLRIGKIIHEALTIANMNAWHFWWVWASGNGGLFNTDTNVWSKRPGSGATSLASSAPAMSASRPRHRAVGRLALGLHEPGGRDRRRGRHQQQQQRNPTAHLRLGSSSLHRDAVGDVGERQPRGQEPHHGGQARFTAPLGAKSVDLRGQTVRTFAASTTRSIRTRSTDRRLL